MNKEFIPYEQALALKELGFDEPCFGYFTSPKELIIQQPKDRNGTYVYFAPTFSQAFRWFREKYSTHVEIHENTDWEEDNESWSFVIFKYKLGDNDGMISSTVDYNTYEEAELACLNKLIEIVKNEKQ